MNQPLKNINSQSDNQIEINKRSVFHQAGRAAAIHLSNKQKQLPAVHFQICIREREEGRVRLSSRYRESKVKYLAQLDGGRLIQSLPVSYAEATQDLTFWQQREYRNAFEADVVNILVGPLAEAKYVALRDNEVFNPNLVYLGALKFYGGKNDLDVVNEYLECFIPNPEDRDRKLAELFLTAYSFVNHRTNWCAVSVLAEFVLTQPKAVIHCDEVISLLDSSRLAA